MIIIGKMKNNKIFKLNYSLPAVLHNMISKTYMWCTIAYYRYL